ncbi:CPBP family intramembrane metalloprotease [Fictibacillus nanhaiensis]|uniref:CPBP family intramembrane metalloprotease n=1 Tax=Fictibacillus nanhaiensis TaxID=742169 RepID=A0ABS2ZRN1_9BACL|nr:CPBP family intramembrane metalloprotease [Fictibacillus nanhaiensis]
MYIELLIFIGVFLLSFYLSQLIRIKIRNSLTADFSRHLLFFLPFLIPSIIIGEPSFSHQITDEIWLGYGIAILASFVGIMLQFKDFNVYLSKDIYYIIQPINLRRLIISCWTLIGSAFVEELFYRDFLPGLVPSWPVAAQILMCSILFTLAHFLQPSTKKTFTIKTYMIIFSLSLFWAISIELTGSIIPAILGHLIYNSPNLVITCLCYYLPRKYNSNYSI